MQQDTKNVGWIDLVQTTLRGEPDSSTLYRFLGPRWALGPETDYLNLGYWRDNPASYRDACDALASQLVTYAGFSNTDPLAVVDVGFGYGEQDLLWAKHWNMSITGLNITAPQILRARERVAQAGLSERIRYLRASATIMPIASRQADSVLALECAFHFNTRTDFFREAQRVLKPGGTIALADIVLLPDGNPAFNPVKHAFLRAGCRFWHIPMDNMYGWEQYRAVLTSAGFTNIRAISIGEHVFPGIRTYMTDQKTLQRFAPVERPFAALAGHAFHLPYARGWYDYLLIAADAA